MKEIYAAKHVIFKKLLVTSIYFCGIYQRITELPEGNSVVWENYRNHTYSFYLPGHVTLRWIKKLGVNSILEITEPFKQNYTSKWDDFMKITIEKF